MYFITTKIMLEVCFSAHPNIQYRTFFICIFNPIALPFFRPGWDFNLRWDVSFAIPEKRSSQRAVPAG